MQTDVGILTNAISEKDLLNDNISVYHIFVVCDNTPIDEDGVLSADDLYDFTWREYADNDPQYYIFSSSEMPTLLKIVSRQTNYTIGWQYFFEILQNHFNNT